MTPLRQEMIQAMQIRNLSPYTQDNYLRAVTKLATFYHRSPDRITQEDIKNYMFQLVLAHKSSWSTCNVIAAGLKFFYEKVLDRHHLVFNIATARKPVKLSQILTTEEVSHLLKTIKNLKHKALIMTAYAGGLRLRELIALRVSDIDSKRMAIRVQSGKGDKERYTLLSEKLLVVLREYWKAEKPKEWLFPGKNPNKPMSSRNAQVAFERAKVRAGITKQGSIHLLRHAFATHLLNAGADIFTIKQLLGHRSLNSTLRYLRGADKILQTTRSPLDLLTSP